MVLKLKKRRSQVDTKAKLLKAALDVFSKDGYDAATTRNIAKKAGVNESLIHRYFESKRGLFLALKKQFRENLLTQFLAYEESETLEEELSKFVNSRLQITSRDKKFFKLAISRAVLDPTLREDMQSYAHNRPQALVERFERFRRKNKIRSDIDLDQLIEILQAFGFAFSMLVNAVECIHTEEAEKLVETTVGILARGLAARA